ncbi:hypothetical protein MYX06_00830 [Patescibacteria group bacterium AH-259-L05]|nr:hypothetical protein [Patescibacteria group bacterium AH-259-L05]
MKKLIASTLLVSLLLVPSLAFGQALNEGLLEFGQNAGLGTKSLPEVIGAIVKVVLSLLGLIATILLIVGGFMWMTSGGNEEKVGKAKQLMGAAIIGLVIVIIAYAAATFVVDQLTGVTGAS